MYTIFPHFLRDKATQETHHLKLFTRFYFELFVTNIRLKSTAEVLIYL